MRSPHWLKIMNKTLEKFMKEDELDKKIDAIINVAYDDEAAHAREDELHMEIIKEYVPEWVQAKLKRLTEADFARHCA